MAPRNTQNNQSGNNAQRNVDSQKETAKLNRLQQEHNRLLQEAQERQKQNIQSTVEQQRELRKSLRDLRLQRELVAGTLTEQKDYDRVLKSIGNTYGKNNVLYKQSQKILEDTQNTVGTTNTIIQRANRLTSKQKSDAVTLAANYKQVQFSVVKGLQGLVETGKLDDTILENIEQQIEATNNFINSIDRSVGSNRVLLAQLEANKKTLEGTHDVAKEAARDIEAMGEAGEMLGRTNFGAGLDRFLKLSQSITGKGPKSLGGLVQGFQKKIGQGATNSLAGQGGVVGGLTKGLAGFARFLGPVGLIAGGLMAFADWVDSGGAAKLAIQAGAVIGDEKMIEDTGRSLFKKTKQYRDMVYEYNYIEPVRQQFAAQSDALQFRQSTEKDFLGFQQSLIRDKIDYEMGLMQDEINFRQNQEKANLDAALSRNKTLFTTAMQGYKNLIGVSERALQAIGSSTEAVLTTVKEVGIGLGLSVKQQIKLSTEAAGLAARYMTSGDEVVKLGKYLGRLSGKSTEFGVNLTKGIEAFAELNDMTPAQLFKAMSESSEDILKYTNLTGEEFAKQVVQLSKMNTSMTSMMKASDSMVLNYKDSIKAEMELSGMIGKNVNLSRVRAKLFAGDMGGAARELKAAFGGLDVKSLNPFVKKQIEAATGLDINEILGISQGKGDSVVSQLTAQSKAIGAGIAQGALGLEIANEKAKMALDQKHRAEMLQFEQDKRRAMLIVEQAFRLQSIKQEQIFRIQTAKLAKEEEIEMAFQNMKKEALTEQFTQTLSGLKNELRDTMPVASFQLMEANIDKFNNVMNGAVASGKITSEEIADATLQFFKATRRGETFDFNKIGGIKKYNQELADAESFRINAINGEIALKKKQLDIAKAIVDIDAKGSYTSQQLQAAVVKMGYSQKDVKDVYSSNLINREKINQVSYKLSLNPYTTKDLKNQISQKQGAIMTGTPSLGTPTVPGVQTTTVTPAAGGAAPAPKVAPAGGAAPAPKVAPASSAGTLVEWPAGLDFLSKIFTNTDSARVDLIKILTRSHESMNQLVYANQNYWPRLAEIKTSVDKQSLAITSIDTNIKQLVTLNKNIQELNEIMVGMNETIAKQSNPVINLDGMKISSRLTALSESRRTIVK